MKRITFDTNYWKTHVHARLAVAMGDEGCVSLFGDKPELHQLFAEDLTSEYRVQTEGRGRKLDEWKLRAGGLDNHWLDCLVGAAAGASMEGCSIPGTEPTKAPKQRSFAERYKEWKEKVGYGPRVFRWWAHWSPVLSRYASSRAVGLSPVKVSRDSTGIPGSQRVIGILPGWEDEPALGWSGV